MVEPYTILNAHVLESLSGHCVARETVVAGRHGCSTMYIDSLVAQKILHVSFLGDERRRLGKGKRLSMND